MPEDERLGEALTDSIALLSLGDIEVKGRMPWSSNATLLVSLVLGDDACDAIYKPLRGERPLWDFDPGLYRREVAAYLVDTALGWRHVPETVVRHDAPFGVGSLQRFVEADFSEHYFTLLESGKYTDQLQTIALFDLLVNNADRKGGHCLLGEDDHIWAIDHGVCFSDEPGKLRTVMWDFAGEPLPADRLADVARLLASGVPDGLDEVLEGAEIDAFVRRCESVLRRGTFPSPGPGRPFPWPLV